MIGIFIACIFFINKVCLLLKMKLGWWIGAVASLLSVYYFILTERYAYTALEIGLTAIMVYGSLNQKSTLVRQVIIWLTIVSIVIIFTLSSFGQLTILEVFGSCLTLTGSLRIANNKRYGWMLCGCNHLICGYVMGQIGQDFFAHFQYASALLSFVNSLFATKQENTQLPA